MRFEFASAGRVIFGPGAVREAGPLARGLGRRPLIVTGRSPARAQPLLDALAAQTVEGTIFSVAGEPTTIQVGNGVERARATGCDWVIGFGGGSAIDAAKAIAALLTNGGEALDYLEVIGGSKPLTQPAAPCLAIPTTAGAGAEVTRNAVLASPEHGVKASLRSPLLLPRVALVDSELTHELPPAITASTGLDALTQLIEPYVCHRANPVTDALCAAGLSRVARSLARACAEGKDTRAREDMALASLLGGLALANAGLGAVHGLAAPIGGRFHAPHGAVCAALLPHTMQTNLRALRERQPERETLRRYEQIARWLTGDATATADDGVRWVRQLCRELAIPSLGSHGLTRESIPVVVAQALQASSMKANPVALTAQELEAILEAAI